MSKAKSKSKSRSKRRSGPSRLPAIAVGALVLLAVLAGAFLFLTRDTSDPALTLSAGVTGSGEVIDVATLDGDWRVVGGTGDDKTVVGYRVEEEFAAGARKVTANGRTGNVSGTLAVADGAVTEAEIIVDLSTLSSDEGRRDTALKTRGLQTNQFPEGSFVLTEPFVLPKLVDGDTFNAKVAGDLTLHGVTQPVTMEMTGRSVGGTFTLQGFTPIVLADYGMDPPTISGFVTVAEAGLFEFIVNFEQQA